jgi:hypothetical protein
MEAYSTLIAQARKKRDQAIREARDAYHRDVQAIRRVCRTLGERIPTFRRPVSERRLLGKGRPFAKLTIVAASERVLMDGKPRTPIEIVVELQKRGYDTGDSPRRIVRAMKAAFQYHPDRFKRDGEGRWFVMAHPT